MFTLHCTLAHTREHLFQLPVAAFGLRTHPIIHPACICRLEQRTVSLTYSFSRENLRPIITWKSHTHAHARTNTHTQFSLFCFTPGNKFQRHRLRSCPRVLRKCASLCVCVCKSVSVHNSLQTTNESNSFK